MSMERDGMADDACGRGVAARMVPRRFLCALMALVLAAACLPLTACGTGAGGSETSRQSEYTEQVADFHNADLGNGWQPAGSLDLEYAKNFTCDYFDGGYKLLCLSDGARYLVVPQGTSIPEGIASDIVVLQQPFEDVYLSGANIMCLIDAVGAVDKVKVCATQQRDWSVASAVEAMESGAMVYGGKYNAPDYDLLLSKHITLAIESTMINHAPEVKNKLEELGISVLTEQSSYESDPLGRMEWVKLYGILFDEEDRATEVFQEQAARAKAVEGQGTGKTVAFFYINSNGAAVVRKPGDYVSKMISYAGGDYIFHDLDDDTAASSVTLEMETFYATAKDADFIIYNSTIDGEVRSISELVAKNQLLADFKAVKDGNVWCTNQDMYQQMMRTGTIIENFHTVLTNPDASELDYMYKLK